MRSLRLFYSDPYCTKGQVVIASRESQYKILHFHHGGLDRLAEIFEDWNLFAKMKDKVLVIFIGYIYNQREMHFL
jgi:hypothetical protein